MGAIEGELSLHARVAQARNHSVIWPAVAEVAATIWWENGLIVHSSNDLLSERQAVGVVLKCAGRLARHCRSPDSYPAECFLRRLLSIEGLARPRNPLLGHETGRGKPGEVERPERPALVGEKEASLELAHKTGKEIHPLLRAQPV